MKPQRLVVGLLAGVTLALTGGYLFVYLYRWEWNRAIISGIIFLAAEMAVIGWVLNSKLKELNRQVDRARADRIVRHLDASRNRSSRAFDWLSPRDSRLGVRPHPDGSRPRHLRSGVAGRVAEPQHGGADDGRPPGPQPLPAGPPARRLPRRPGRPPAGPPGARRRAVLTVRAAFGLLAVTVVTVLGVLALADATKFEGETEGHGATQVLFEVEAKNYHHDLEDAAASLWFACVGAVNWEQSTAPEDIGDDVYRAAVQPALGEDSRRRFRGCLEDATLDKVRGDVERMETVPAVLPVDGGPVGQD